MCCQEATESKIQPGVFQSFCFQAIPFPTLQPTLLSQHREWSACFHLYQLVCEDQSQMLTDYNNQHNYCL